jgi:hypothetical protein
MFRRPKSRRIDSSNSAASTSDVVLPDRGPTNKFTDVDLIHTLHCMQRKLQWLEDDQSDEGVVLRRVDGTYLCSTTDLLERTDSLTTAMQLQGFEVSFM